MTVFLKRVFKKWLEKETQSEYLIYIVSFLKTSMNRVFSKIHRNNPSRVLSEKNNLFYTFFFNASEIGGENSSGHMRILNNIIGKKLKNALYF